MEKGWLKVKEAATVIGISYKSLYSLLARGEIRHTRKKGLGIRIHRDWLDEWLREGEVVPIREQLER